VIDQIEERFDKMTVTRRYGHVFLGLRIRYTAKGYRSCHHAGVPPGGPAGVWHEYHSRGRNAGPKMLILVVGDVPRLDQADAETFHSITAKLLYVSTRLEWIYYFRLFS
jgi:hypothetical protein